jgi:pyruvate/2-oxoglutarate dehydrogenase complex dihydrolipoamide dehydrogenase (E3) component
VRWEPNTRITRAARRAAAKVVMGERADGEQVEIEADEILIATGRAPNIERLGLDDAGIALSGRGIVVDATMRTTNAQVYAVGDVTGIYPFTHVADYQARIAEHNLLEDGPPVKSDYRVVPWVTFCDPELARVGLTEDEARAGAYDVVTATVPFADLPRAMTMDERHGMVRLVVDRQDRKILGGHVLGAGAGELIGEIAVVMEQGLPVDAIAATIHPYPTMSEAVFWAAYQMVNDVLTPPTAANT